MIAVKADQTILDHKVGGSPFRDLGEVQADGWGAAGQSIAQGGPKRETQFILFSGIS